MRVAVVGAGVAGCVLSEHLLKQGHQVCLFEKSRGVGGRLNTKRLPWGAPDLGAQYFTARSPRFAAQVERWCHQGIASRWKFQPHKLENGQLRTSPDDTPRYVGSGKMHQVLLPLSEQLEFVTQTQINQIACTNGQWSLSDQHENGWHGFDRLVLAIPAAQAKVLLGERALGQAIPDAVLTPCAALAVHTKALVDDTIQGVFGEGAFSWLGRVDSKPGRNAPGPQQQIWVLHASDQLSETLDKTQGERLLDEGHRWLTQVIGNFELLNHYVHYWRYARQAVNIDAPGVLTDGSLAIIGDWTLGGKIQGAYESAMCLGESDFFNGGNR